MNWEMVSGVTGIVSALGTAISLFQIKPFISDEKKSDNDKLKEKYFSYALASCGWVLCVLCWAWITNEYGYSVTDREMREFLGISLSFPAIILFIYGFKRIKKTI